jgi:hypothetical protein
MYETHSARYPRLREIYLRAEHTSRASTPRKFLADSNAPFGGAKFDVARCAMLGHINKSERLDKGGTPVSNMASLHVIVQPYLSSRLGEELTNKGEVVQVCCGPIQDPRF